VIYNENKDGRKIKIAITDCISMQFHCEANVLAKRL
jgi:hypothetical protein